MNRCKKYRPAQVGEAPHHHGKNNCESCVFFSQKNCLSHGGGALNAQGNISDFF